LLYGGVPAEFESAFGLDESVARLSAVTRELPIFTRQRVAQGEVYKYWVVIRRPYRFRLYDLDPRPLGFEPYFDGDFLEVDGCVRLVGRFRLSLLTSVFITIWLGFVVFILGLSLRSLMAGDLRLWWFPLAALGFLVLGVLFVWFGRQRARGDIPWLTNFMEDTLSSKPAPPSSDATSRDRPVAKAQVLVDLLGRLCR
jgi:hypothetical protein